MKIKMMAILATATVGMWMLTGCETLSQTSGENANTVVHAQDTNMKQLPDDVERLLLLDHPSRLSAKPVPSN